MVNGVGIKAKDGIIIHNKKLEIYAQAWAMEDCPGLGETALFRVSLNSVDFPGISEMVINLNWWDVYRDDDVYILKRIRDVYLSREIVR